MKYYLHGGSLNLVLLTVIYTINCIPLWSPQNVGRNIRHLPCVSRRSGEKGTCMFAFSCAKLNGTHLGTCIDRFYFGSCCKIPDEDTLDIVPPIDDNSLNENDIRPIVTSSTTPRIRPAVTQKPISSTTSRPTAQSTSVKPTTSSPNRPTLSSIKTTTLRPSTTHKTTTVGPTLVTWTTLEENKPQKPHQPPSKRPPVTISSPSTPVPPTLVTKLPSTSGSKPSPTSGITSRPPSTSSKPQQSNNNPQISSVKPNVSIRPQISTTVKPATKPNTPLTNKPTIITAKPTASSGKPQTTGTKPQINTSTVTYSTARPQLTSTKPKPSSTTKPKPTSTIKPKPSTQKPLQSSSTGKPSQVSSAKPYIPTSTTKPTVKPKPTPVSKPTYSSTPIIKPTQTTLQPNISTTPSTTWVPVSVTTHEPTTIFITENPSTKKPPISTGIPSTATQSTVNAVTISSTGRPSIGSSGTTTSGYRPTISSSTSTGTTTTERPSIKPVTVSPSSSKPFSSTKPSIDSDISLQPVSTVSPPGSTSSNNITRPVTQSSSTVSLQSTTASAQTATTTPQTSTTLPDSNEVESYNKTNFKEVCGRRLFPEARIVGGQVSGFGKWPWQISLRQWRTSTYLHKCGAALLNENWAITAAHCVENVPPSDLLLRLGEHDLSTEDEPYGYQERRVQIVASHPQFDPRTFEYDLALLRFYEPVTFQPNIIPVCVPEDDTNFVGSLAYVTGWGRLYEDGPLPSILQEVSVPVINNTLCETMYRAAGYIEHIPEIFICAGWKKGGFDSCEGDSGGPMVIQRPDKRWLLAGVISWGIGCAEPNQPGVYTRISQFRHWINQILQF